MERGRLVQRLALLGRSDIVHASVRKNPSLALFTTDLNLGLSSCKMTLGSPVARSAPPHSASLKTSLNLSTTEPCLLDDFLACQGPCASTGSHRCAQWSAPCKWPGWQERSTVQPVRIQSHPGFEVVVTRCFVVDLHVIAQLGGFCPGWIATRGKVGPLFSGPYEHFTGSTTTCRPSHLFLTPKCAQKSRRHRIVDRKHE